MTLGFDLSRSDAATFREDLMNIARTTLSSKVLSQDKNYFANLAVDAVLRLKVRVSSEAHRLLLMATVLQGSTDLDHIQIIKKVGGKLTDSYLDEG
jgi:T-complex protein 1 subunit beta